MARWHRSSLTFQYLSGSEFCTCSSLSTSRSCLRSVMSQGETHVRWGTEWVSQAHGSRLWEETLIFHGISLWLPSELSYLEQRLFFSFQNMKYFRLCRSLLQLLSSATVVGKQPETVSKHTVVCVPIKLYLQIGHRPGLGHGPQFADLSSRAWQEAGILTMLEWTKKQNLFLGKTPV